jgi:hypothetical protein
MTTTARPAKPAMPKLRVEAVMEILRTTVPRLDELTHGVPQRRLTTITDYGWSVNDQLAHLRAGHFSKKIRNHAAAVALYHMHYNFARPHRSLANPYPWTPAMAAGISDHIWTCEEIADLLD